MKNEVLGNFRGKYITIVGDYWKRNEASFLRN